MKAKNQPQDQGAGVAHGGFQGHGRGRGGGARKGRGKIICYNFHEEIHFAHDYQIPTHPSCECCGQFDHVIEYCPVLKANM